MQIELSSGRFLMDYNLQITDVDFRTNKDLDPVPPARRKWGVISFIAYWVSDAFNAATWQFASAMLAVGLSWRESLGIVALSFFIISWVVS